MNNDECKLRWEALQVLTFIEWLLWLIREHSLPNGWSAWRRKSRCCWIDALTSHPHDAPR